MGTSLIILVVSIIVFVSLFIIYLYNHPSSYYHKEKKPLSASDIEKKVSTIKYITAYEAVEKSGKIYYKDKMIYKNIFKYDSKDNLVESIENLYKDSNFSKKIISIIYDENGKILAQVTTMVLKPSGDKIIMKKFFHYNDKNKLTETLSHTANDITGDTFIKELFNYSDTGYMITGICYRADGFLFWKKYSLYDNNNNLIEETKHNSDEELEYKILTKYDNKNNLIEEKRYNSNGKIENEKFLKYDNKNNLVENKNFSDHGITIYRHEYDYGNDIKGNWFKQLVTLNKKPILIKEMEVDYY